MGKKVDRGPEHGRTGLCAGAQQEALARGDSTAPGPGGRQRGRTHPPECLENPDNLVLSDMSLTS